MAAGTCSAPASPGSDFFTPASHLPLRGNGKGAWFGWPDDPKIEALREAWFNAPDLAAQKKVGAEVQLQAFENVPYYPLGWRSLPTAFRPDITGVPEGFPIFWNVADRAAEPAARGAVIVIFGAAVRPGGRPSTTLHRRVEAAAAFGERFAEPLFVPTGALGVTAPSEASVMAGLLAGRGVPPDRILLEETGTDTLSSVRAVAGAARRPRCRRAGVRREQSVSSAALHSAAAADGNSGARRHSAGGSGRDALVAALLLVAARGRWHFRTIRGTCAALAPAAGSGER